MSELHRFLSELYAGQQGVLELRTFDHPQANKLRNFVAVIDGQYEHAPVEKFITETTKLKIGAFYGVALRSEASLKDGKGDAAHCHVLTALFVDVDDKHLGRDESLRRLATFPLKPSMMVDSGGGFHPYWILKDPIHLKGEGMQRAKSLLRRLASAVADVVDESVSEPARVLRLPSGFNFKKQYPEPRPVRLMIDDEPPRYTIAEIEAVIPAEKTTSERESFQVPKTVKSGDRHEILYKFLRSQKARGISLEVALVGCFKLNEDQCKPPIPKDELETYLRRVWEQGDSVAFKTENEKRDFIRDRNGTIIKDCQENIERACERLEYSFSHDLFADRLLVKNGKFDATLLTDQHFTALWLKIDREFRFRPSYQFYERVIYNITYGNAFHPVRQYFDSLKWDGVHRLESWLHIAAQAVDEGSDSREGPGYLQRVSKLLFLAPVRRIRQPGAKYDEMVVLESPQGFSKSTALRAMCPKEEYFSDDLPLNVEAKQIIERTQGKMLIEASEMHGSRKADRDHLKSMLSRQVDGPARLAYARTPVERARQFVVVGTTNSSEYLADSTGSRRFWPVKVGRFDIAWIIEYRDQLWAEAAFCEARGDSIRMEEALWAEAGAVQEKRREVDAWEDTVRNHIEDLEPASTGRKQITAKALWEVLGVSVERRDRMGSRRIAEIMQRFGYERTTIRGADGKVQTGYVRYGNEDIKRHEPVVEGESEKPYEEAPF
jgi:predicted P-loop ATPase